MKEEKMSITNLEQDVLFKGKLKFKDTILSVKGKIEGVVESQNGKVIVENEGSIEGMMKSEVFENHGLFKGDAEIYKDCTLFSGSKIDGKIKVKSIMVEKGAVLNGTCQMEK
ncbi:MAG TPA: hypothetical protein DHW82_10960 [Spirochaetia bacterium]|nr:MAG: hypothetical protein A2Y41_10870 [Spirochaetes bacterium GWB1_36_13]HCL57513.1 hypothetical protein [Spirochaetia bacterium]